MAYLNAAEIESAVLALTAFYTSTTELIELPWVTTEGRVCHALRIGAGPEAGMPGVLIIGGVHPREWVPPDLCISLAADVLEAYAKGTGLGYGTLAYSAADIRLIVENLNLFIFPNVNPDGRVFSQTIEPLWRRNRNPAESAGNPDCIGVDLNRNYDFLWDFENRFSPSALVSTSTAPCSQNQTYRGSAALSEPETQNVVHLLDAHPQIRWFIDLHSYGELILYSWGDDQNQSVNPTMHFANSAFDALRGTGGDAVYGEYISETDLAVVTTLASRMAETIRLVRGREYTTGQAFSLYATSGASDDYAYSRHFLNLNHSKVHSFTIECGTEFQPTWDEAENIIIEVSAGLVAFCLEALTPS